MNNKCLGQRIKELREQSHLSQSQVAAYLNIDQSYLSKIESGERMITVDHMERLAELYGCTFEELNSFETKVEQLKISFRAKEITVEDMNKYACKKRMLPSNSFSDYLKSLK